VTDSDVKTYWSASMMLAIRPSSGGLLAAAQGSTVAAADRPGAS
jgi:hypothetical protein